jgi:hypothetical protein
VTSGQLIACRRGRNDGNKPQGFDAVIGDTVDSADRGNHHVPRSDRLTRASLIQVIFTFTGENCPGVLAVGMDMGGDRLTGQNMPSHNHRIGGFGDHRSDGFGIIGGLEKFGAVEDPRLSHEIWAIGVCKRDRDIDRHEILSNPSHFASMGQSTRHITQKP